MLIVALWDLTGKTRSSLDHAGPNNEEKIPIRRWGRETAWKGAEWEWMVFIGEQKKWGTAEKSQI